MVVMHFDDIAHNPMNPHPGTVINNPSAKDVYHGVPKDYTGANVTADIMLAVLKGDKEHVKGIGSGKVIDSGPHDKVFLFYADHGAPGLLGMPSGAYLYADELNEAIKYKAHHDGFMEMVIYMEACESGSIFDGILSEDLNVYAVTAANDIESSWGVYCPFQTPPPPKEYNTCLGDLFSVSWMEDDDKLPPNGNETLYQQFRAVRSRVSSHHTYAQGSHVERFGTARIGNETVLSWLTQRPPAPKPQPAPAAPGRPSGWPGLAQSAAARPAAGATRTPNCGQHDAERFHYEARVQSAPEGSALRAAESAALEAFLSARARIDTAVERVLLALARAARAVDRPEPGHVDGSGASGAAAQAAAWATQRPPPGEAVVRDWDCLRSMVRSWEQKCGPLGQYGMRHARALANLCNHGVSPAELEGAAATECGRALE